MPAPSPARVGPGRCSGGFAIIGAAREVSGPQDPLRDLHPRLQTITDFAPLWDELFPAEQARIVRLLVERVDLAPDGIHVMPRAEGLQTLVEELRSREAKAA